MIRSPWVAAGCAVIGILATIPISLVIFAAVAMSEGPSATTLSIWRLGLLAALPPVVAMGATVLLVARRNRKIATFTALLTLVVGYSLVPIWLSVSTLQVEFVNDTESYLSVYYARESDRELHQFGPPTIGPGESYRSPGGLAIEGPWLRMVAIRSDGKTVLDRTYTWSQLHNVSNRVVLNPVDSAN